MIGLPSGTPIYLCTTPVDFRKGFDGLTRIVTTAMGHSVTDGELFPFVNRKCDRIKALWWETGSLTLWYRRLEQGTVELPKTVDGQSQVSIDNVKLAMWIASVPLNAAKVIRKQMKVAQVARAKKRKTSASSTLFVTILAALEIRKDLRNKDIQSSRPARSVSTRRELR